MTKPIEWRNRIVESGVKPASKFLAHPSNWRTHPQRQRKALKGSLDTLGWVAPVLENRRTGYLIDGHERVWQALQNGDAQVPYIVVDLDEAEEAQALLSLDAIAALAQTDAGKVDELLRMVETGNADVQEFLASMADEAGLEYGQPPQEAPEPQIDKAAELQEKWQTATGQLWEIPSKSGNGVHRLLCGDCTKAEDVARVMGADKAEMVWTDPPYGMFLDTDFSSMKNELEFAQAKGVKPGKRYNRVEGDNDDFKPELITSLFDNYGYCKEMFLFGADYYTDCLKDKNEGSWIVWDKRSNDDTPDEIVESRDRIFTSAFELCWSKARHKRKIARIMWACIFGTEKEHNHERYHPTQKPVRLLEWFMNNWGKQGDIVADPYVGSGTTIVACERLSRLCRAIEISPAYVAVSLQRLADMGLEPRLVA